MERETCRNAAPKARERGFRCSECNSVWHLLRAYDWGCSWEMVPTPGFCPQCGREVER